MPTLVVWIDVCTPYTLAAIAGLPPGLMWLSTIPVPVLAPLPAMVRLDRVKDFVRAVPSMETAIPSTLLMLQGPMMYGSDAVPLPLVTQPQLAKSASLWIAMAA